METDANLQPVYISATIRAKGSYQPPTLTYVYFFQNFVIFRIAHTILSFYYRQHLESSMVMNWKWFDERHVKNPTWRFQKRTRCVSHSVSENTWFFIINGWKTLRM